jgi:hypothetical protein
LSSFKQIDAFWQIIISSVSFIKIRETGYFGTFLFFKQTLKRIYAQNMSMGKVKKPGTKKGKKK